ncbi:hypothetical protein XH94_06710 [Bradyrhizobium zhanjiangense]|uniref:HTH domain-containing protein n=1 Tax=Bradyrhizobium zhanjiangense TaxID=1325107 RepID=A0A4Q0ST92_9BRAD|nr:hypothetical protein XH94_06710 [Bradyrhizobium zhanjiangense]
MEGWAHFHLGKVMQARTIARTLVARRDESSDRELDINTAIESGDWSHLQAIVAREVSRLDKLDAKVLMRLARIAFESGSLYVDKFRDAAIERAPDSPEIFLAAYHMSLERGEEYQESRAHEWFQKAVALSGTDGPVQTVKLKDVVDRTSGWNQRVENIDGMLADVKIPLYLAARSLNRQPLDFFLGTAIRNSRSTQPAQQFPVLAFSGSRPLFDLSGVRRLALDITTVLTLEFLGLLQKTIAAFDQVIISPSTLSSLFADRQFIRFQQPSEVTKAKAIKKLLGNGKLSVLKTLRTDAEVAGDRKKPRRHPHVLNARRRTFFREESSGRVVPNVGSSLYRKVGAAVGGPEALPITVRSARFFGEDRRRKGDRRARLRDAVGRPRNGLRRNRSGRDSD